MSNQPPNQPQGSSQQTQRQNQQQPPQQPAEQQRGQQQQPPQQQPPQQPPQGPPGGGARGGRRPARGGSSDTLVNAGKVALAIAIVGVAIGLIPLLFGFIGDPHALYGTEEEVDRYDDRFQNEPSDERQTAQDREKAQQQQSLVRFIVGGVDATFVSSYFPGFLQILALLTAGVAGAVAAVRLSGETSDVVVTAAAGALVGAFLFVFLATYLATQGWETVPEAARQGEAANEVSIRYGALLINSLAIGVLGAIAGGGSALFTDLLGE